MARSLRIEYPGAWYHVMNRGARHQEIFHDSTCYRLFLDLLSDTHLKYQLEVHAYCLMSNHYHLLVRTPHPNLHKIMRHINGIFTQQHNRLNNTDGSLFRGRYKAILVEADSYLLQLSRYIHLNPEAAGIVSDPADYLWSSYQCYLGQQEVPHWLNCSHTLEHFGLKDPIENYKRFVLDEIGAKPRVLFEQGKRFPILGTEKFVKQTSCRHVSNVMDREIPEILQVIKRFSPTIEDVIKAVSSYFHINDEDVLIGKQNSPGYLAKKIAIYLAVQLPGQKLKTVAHTFNGISCSGVSQIYGHIQKSLKNDQSLVEHVNNVGSSLQNSN